MKRLAWVLALGVLCSAVANGQAKTPRMRRKVAITFDDLPAHGPLPPGTTRVDVLQSLARTLVAQHLPPTYGFLNGVGVEGERDEQDALTAWRAGGQLLANHTFSHPDIDDMPASEFEEDIAGDEPMLQQRMAGQDWHWFRYPYLHEGDTRQKRRAVRAWLAQHGYRIAEVNLDFEDYLWNDPFERCSVQGNEAAIARLHDTYLATADRFLTIFHRLSFKLYGRDVKYVLLLHAGAFDAKMLPELLDLLRGRGFSFISLAEAEQDLAYRANPDTGDSDGGTLMEQVMQRRGIDVPKMDKPEVMLDGLCR